MSIDNSRRFLVNGSSWGRAAQGVDIRMGYLSTDEEREVVVTILNGKGIVTIMGAEKDSARPEYRYEVPIRDAEEMLDLSIGSVIEKRRFTVEQGGLAWEVDEFSGENHGLVLARAMVREDQAVKKPEWVGEEVTAHRKYLDLNLVFFPFLKWKAEESDPGADLLDRATELAAKAHRSQVRKKTDIPYISHPFGVALLLAKAGCSDEVIAAGILHDATEDTYVTPDYIRGHFGAKVASMVAAASESDKTLPWEVRKEAAIEAIKNKGLEEKMVSCADKLHNIRSIARARKEIGERVWARCNRGKDLQEWYYRRLVNSLEMNTSDKGYRKLFTDYKRAVAHLFGEQNITS